MWRKRIFPIRWQSRTLVTKRKTYSSPLSEYHLTSTSSSYTFASSNDFLFDLKFQKNIGIDDFTIYLIAKRPRLSPPFRLSANNSNKNN